MNFLEITLIGEEEARDLIARNPNELTHRRPLPHDYLKRARRYTGMFLEIRSNLVPVPRILGGLGHRSMTFDVDDSGNQQALSEWYQLPHAHLYQLPHARLEGMNMWPQYLEMTRLPGVLRLK